VVCLASAALSVSTFHACSALLFILTVTNFFADIRILGTVLGAVEGQRFSHAWLCIQVKGPGGVRESWLCGRCCVSRWWWTKG